MKRTVCLAAALSLILAAAAPAPVFAQRNDQWTNGSRNYGAAAAIAAMIAIGVGIAVAKHGDNHDSVSQWDENRYGQPFSPSPQVTCLPKPRKCFERGHVSWNWTRRIFG